MASAKCPLCQVRSPNVVHNGLKCWIKRDKNPATFTAVLKKHLEEPSNEEIIHMKQQLVKLKPAWHKRGWMEFEEVSGPYDSPLPGGHYLLRIKPKKEVAGIGR